MRFGIPSLALGAAVLASIPQASIAADSSACAVTAAPNPAFAAPPKWEMKGPFQENYFLFGTTGLWAWVHNHWKLGMDGRKLPYFSAYYDWWGGEHHPEMVVVARRLDEPASLVWAEEVNGAGPSFRFGEAPDPAKPGFMVTRLEIPTAGCWEISARYRPVGREPQVLTYTVLVEP